MKKGCVENNRKSIFIVSVGDAALGVPDSAKRVVFDFQAKNILYGRKTSLRRGGYQPPVIHSQ